jgi:hypothetical protein
LLKETNPKSLSFLPVPLILLHHTNETKISLPPTKKEPTIFAEILYYAKNKNENGTETNTFKIPIRQDIGRNNEIEFCDYEITILVNGKDIQPYQKKIKVYLTDKDKVRIQEINPKLPI